MKDSVLNTMRGVTIILCLLPLVSVDFVDAQQGSKWSWSSNDRNNVDNRLPNRRKYESLEDFGDRYEVNEQTTRKPIRQGDEFSGNSIGAGNGGYGFNRPNGITGNGYNGNGFGAYVPQGLGGGPIPNNFNNFPLYGNQFNGPYNPGFGGFQPNNFKPGPGFNNNYYPGSDFGPNYGNNPYYLGGYGPNRYPGYNPLGNSAANGILVGPGGPTGLYGRPPGFGVGLAGVNGPGHLAGFYNNYGPPYNGFNGGYNGIIPFNSKAGSGILAEADYNPKGKSLHKKSTK